MRRGFPVRLLRPETLALLASLAVASITVTGASAPAARRAVALCRAEQPMSDAEMAAATAAWFRKVPPHASGVASAATASTPVDTFVVVNYKFDADHNLSTPIDTVHIQPGQSVLFQWSVGSHTTTSGTPGDDDAGSLWNFAINSTHPQVVITLSNPGTYPFFCQPHSFLGMLGVIIVDDSATPSKNASWGQVKARYR
ncbi:MAG TPA: plastocyanin/azurin family copper-binding protein [Candidatus Acidoferrales bacterium]|nr:plastocyanin/azurin family copper-binding protein [Candidatus Acidoferrales bacterium]